MKTRSRWCDCARPLRRHRGWAAAVLIAGAGCIEPDKRLSMNPRPVVAPSKPADFGEALPLDASQIEPMYTELMPIDLPTVVQVALADNFDIQRAQEAVQANRGQYESAYGRAFPVIVPTAVFEHVEGTVRATEGNLVGVGFDTFQPSVALQWIVNPGRVVNDIVAAKKRWRAVQHREEVVIQNTLRAAANQFYDLALAQARVSAARQGLLEAEELLRINRLRERTGTGVPADVRRAEARVAERRQELVRGLQALYDASVALAFTLHLDPSVTLVPSVETIPSTQLVRDGLTLDGLLGMAMSHRPDLESVRQLVEAAAADYGSAWWSGLGPTVALGYQYGGITGHADNVKAPRGIPGTLVVNPGSATGSFSGNPVANGLIREAILRGSRRLDGRDDQTFEFSDQQRAGAAAGWRLSLSTFGELKTAKAIEKQAMIDAAQAMDRVHAQVVRAAQSSRANRELVGLARQQVAAAEESLRLTEAHLEAGVMTTLDVLQAQDAATRARVGYAEAVVAYNQSQIDLLAALGLLTGESLLGGPSADSNGTSSSAAPSTPGPGRP